MNSTIYAIPDLHGRYDLFQKAIALITERGGGKVVFLGDYIDRGPQSAQIIEALMSGPPEGQTWVCLQGNHEVMCTETLMQGLDQNWWIGNGGDATSRSFNGSIPRLIVDWMDKLPRYYETESLVFVHAGVDPLVDLKDQTEEMLLWFRPPEKNYDYNYNGKHIVHGHTPFKDGPVCLMGRTNLDCGAFFTGRLAIGVFQDDRFGPVDILFVRDDQ